MQSHSSGILRAKGDAIETRTGMRLHRAVLPALIAALLVAFTPALLAQFAATLSGTVADTSGAVIPNATVVLTNPATHQQKTTTSSGSGFYSFSELAPGIYTVTVSAQGFESKTFTTVGISAELPRGLNVQLQVGAASQTVTVNGNETPILNTSNADIATTITSDEVTRLPSFGRDPYELLRTSVGITGEGARSGSGGAIQLPNNQMQNQSNYGIFQTENQIQISAAGQRVSSNTYDIDGVSVDSLLHGGSAVITPSIESVAQMTVRTSDYDATLGYNVGAHILTVTNSGANQFHGSAFFQYDEPGLNAYQPYGGPTSTPGVFAPPTRDDLQQRDWAASLGGPILKNKLFWFASYEEVKSSLQSFSETYVPTPQWYAGLAASRPSGLVAGTLSKPAGQAIVHAILPGSCSALQTICAPVGTGFDIGSFGGTDGQYLPNVNANGTAASPNLYTGAGLDGVPDVEFAQIDTPSQYRGVQLHERTDWFITRKDQLFGEIFTQKLDQSSFDGDAGAAPDTDLPFRPFNSSATVVYIHTFSPSLLNEARANYTRFADNQIRDTAGLVNWGVPGLYAQNYGFGSLDFTNLSAPTTPYIAAENTYEVRDMVTKVFGSQSLQMGGEIRLEQDNDDDSGYARPNYAFQGIWDMANDAPLYEGIAANPNTGGVGNAQRYFRRNYIAAFVQDEWKARPNLTVNAGIRYNYFGALTNKSFNINNMVLSTTPGLQIIHSRLVPVSQLYPATPDAIAPKLGIAWLLPHTNRKVVLHAGGGVSFDNLDEYSISPAYENGPGYFDYGLCCAGLQAANPSAAGTGIVFEYGTSDSPFSYAPNPNLAVGVNPVSGTPNNFTAPGGTASTPQIETYSVLPNMRQPTLYTYSLDTQYQLPWQMAFTLQYQGSTGFHFLRLVDQNFLYDQSNGTCASGGACMPGVNQTPFYAAYVPTSDVHTSYNAMNAYLEKRLQHGVTFNLIYTWSKSMDTSSNEGPGSESNQTDPAQPETEYGPSDFDVRNRFTFSGTWNLPEPEHHLLMKEALGGWQIDPIYTWYTGFPWTPVIGVASVAETNGASTIAPTRPLGYGPGSGAPAGSYALSSCSNNAFIHGGNFPLGGANYFTYGTSGPPGIGRNSFRGPCYMDTDISFAKQVTFNMFHDHSGLFRFQANIYNIFNHTNLQPISFASTEALISTVTTPGTHVDNPLFGLSPGADNGRVIEFFGRFQF
ncbi:MAG TPA: carboxypeptidase regulatory-like domain-containing protein [Acidobacteriaceae bacterium]|nr:carboxypeptidase regulatory-like domain-containing protein [Acidobacteriaceae bacterium]